MTYSPGAASHVVGVPPPSVLSHTTYAAQGATSQGATAIALLPPPATRHPPHALPARSTYVGDKGQVANDFLHLEPRPSQSVGLGGGHGDGGRDQRDCAEQLSRRGVGDVKGSSAVLHAEGAGAGAEGINSGTALREGALRSARHAVPAPLACRPADCVYAQGNSKYGRRTQGHAPRPAPTPCPLCRPCGGGGGGCGRGRHGLPGPSDTQRQRARRL